MKGCKMLSRYSILSMYIEQAKTFPLESRIVNFPIRACRHLPFF